ncbi:MAG: RipA family octameric membrane protein [Gammaproteobacteria bacterium]
MTEQGPHQQELLELYKLHAELADRVSQRREGANRLYVTILTGLLVANAAIIRWGGPDVLEFIPIILIMAGSLGVGLSASWYVIIRSYRQLNTGKFAALDELESKLAFPFFRREWELLEQGKSFRRYWKLTTAETTLPVLFGFAYLAIALYGLVLFLR